MKIYDNIDIPNAYNKLTKRFLHTIQPNISESDFGHKDNTLSLQNILSLTFF